jgi:uncharacterized protein
MHVWKRRLAKYSRWLHIYASMTSFVIVFFFAVTGWTLNHAELFNGRERTAKSSGAVDARWTNTGTAEVGKLEIVEALRRAHHVGGTVSDFRTDDDQVSITFKGPGYSADATVDRKSGKYELTESRLGLVAIANDLHKGRDTGTVWKATIDVSAGLLTFISLTGLILIYFIHKHRLAGVILLVAGGALTAVLYAIWVP